MSAGESGVSQAAPSSTEGVSLISASAPPQFDVYVKGSPETGSLGDCPFSSRLMLQLEEKGIPYNKILTDELNIPEWVGELLGQKTVPFVFELKTGSWMTDSDKLVPYIEDKYPGKKLGKPDEVTQAGSKIMPTLIEFLKAKKSDPSAPGGSPLARTLGDLEEQLQEVESALQESGGPYLGGQDVNAADLKIAPQLKHVIIATKTIQNYTLPEKFQRIRDLMAAIEQRPSWKATYYTEKYVSDGWKKKMEKMGAL